MNKDEELYLGNNAEVVLNNPAYIAAKARQKAKIFDNWSNTGLFQRRKREKLWLMMRLADEMEADLDSMVTDAAVIEHEQDRQKQLKRVK